MTKLSTRCAPTSSGKHHLIFTSEGSELERKRVTEGARQRERERERKKESKRT